jgi:hypothetical protein
MYICTLGVCIVIGVREVERRGVERGRDIVRKEEKRRAGQVRVRGPREMERMECS